MDKSGSGIADDQPLRAGHALAGDHLHRTSFAAAAVTGLRGVGPNSGIVLSIEGAWGSGKTSTLALIEDLLKEERPQPVVVRFNPWLIGDRDSLLRQFLSSLAASVNIGDTAADGKRVAKELKSYAKAFDILKFVPGAEPWATLVKTVVEATGEATSAVAELKSPDVEKQKNKVEDALRRFPRRVIVFIDDVDRLFPSEVFEMVRIIKSVGDLPNVGYVIAWDPKYVVAALTSASIPHAESYLDKVVQARLPIPAMSLRAKNTLIDGAIARLEPEAIRSHFPNDEHRLSMLYWSGLRELLEQPRDVTRVFNTVALIEPRLRGELAFGDVVGLAALMVRAAPVFEVLKREPRWFVGNLPGDSAFKKNEDVARAGKDLVQAAVDACDLPHATRQLLNQMFPLTAEKGGSFDRSNAVDGRIGSANRLVVALQLSLSDSDVSFVAARRYLHTPSARAEIASAIKEENCLEFLESLGDVAVAVDGRGIDDLDSVCLAIARLVDVQPFPGRSKDRSRFFSLAAEDVALRAIEVIVKAVNAAAANRIAEKIVRDPSAMTVAVEVFARSYLSAEGDYKVVAPPQNKEKLRRALTKTVLGAAASPAFFRTAHPGFVLFRMPKISSSACRRVFQALATHDHSLDQFITEVMARSFDSHKGQIYAVPENPDHIGSYTSIDFLRRRGRQRLLDKKLNYPARAAWQALVEDQAIYGKDGSLAER